MSGFFAKLPSFYLSYKGRIKRMPFFLGYLSLLFFAYIISSKISSGPAHTLIFLCLSYGLFSLSIKRLRDINRSGWYCLLYFVPVANLLLWLYLLSKKSAVSTTGDDDGFHHSEYARAS